VVIHQIDFGGVRPIKLKDDAPIARYRNGPLPAPLASQWVKPQTRQIVIDYGLTDIVAERFDAGVRSGE
jgi:hypothetical protein